MDLSLSDDQEALGAMLRTLMRHQSTSASIRANEALGHDAKLWSSLTEVGAAGIGVDESLGGGGAPMAMLATAAEELGRAMAPVPFIEHTVASRLLARTHPPHPDFASVVDGDLIAAVAWLPAHGDEPPLVAAGAIADIVIALQDATLVAVRSPPPGAAVPNHASSPLAPRSLVGCPRHLLVGDGAALIADAATEWQILTAAALVGLSAAALELAVSYVKQRKQFGVLIGSFQSVQHGLADLPGLVDGARMLSYEAAWALDGAATSHTGVGATELASMALLFASEVAATATSRCVQYHGGYGVAEEYDAQLLYRRARGWPLLGGSLLDTERHLASLLFDGDR